MPLNPRKDKIILKRAKLEKVTESGLVLATEDKFDENVGEVISVNESVTDIKIGDKVVFDQYHFDKIVVKNEEYLIIDQQYILAIL